MKDIIERLEESTKHEYMEVGDRVEVKTKRGWHPGTITSMKQGTKWTTFGVVTDDGGDLKGKTQDQRYSRNKIIKFVSTAGDKKAAQASLQRRADVAKRKDDRANAGSDILADLKLQPGDVVLIKYRDTTREEVVTGTNYRTGKVGIDRFRGNEMSKREYLKKIKDHNDSMEVMEYLYGLKVGRKSKNASRWLAASLIVKIERRAPTK